jgi:hypothetical protein
MASFRVPAFIASLSFICRDSLAEKKNAPLLALASSPLSGGQLPISR